METDRFQHSPKTYIISLVSMIISLILFGFGGYIFPKVAFGFTYKMPLFMYNWIHQFQMAYDLNEKKAGWVILIIVFFLGLGASIVTYALSNRIETSIYHLEPEKEKVNDAIETSNKWRESIILVSKIIFILSLVFIGAKLFQWIISID